MLLILIYLEGWNFVSFEIWNNDFIYSIRQPSNSPGYAGGSVFGAGYLNVSDNLYIGWLNWAGSDISYLIQSARLTMSYSSWISYSISISSPNRKKKISSNIIGNNSCQFILSF